MCVSASFTSTPRPPRPSPPVFPALFLQTLSDCLSIRCSSFSALHCASFKLGGSAVCTAAFELSTSKRFHVSPPAHTHLNSNITECTLLLLLCYCFQACYTSIRSHRNQSETPSARLLLNLCVFIHLLGPGFICCRSNSAAAGKIEKQQRGKWLHTQKSLSEISDRRNEMLNANHYIIEHSSSVCGSGCRHAASTCF